MEDVSWAQVMFMSVMISAVSYWNVRMSGMIWVETKFLGGWSRLVAQCGSLSAVLGFLWCYVLVFFCTKHGFLNFEEIPQQTLMTGLALYHPVMVFAIGTNTLLFLAHYRIDTWRTKHVPNMQMAREFERYREIRAFKKAFEIAVQKIVLCHAFGYESPWVLRRKDKTGRLACLGVGLAVVLGLPIIVSAALINLHAATVPLEE